MDDNYKAYMLTFPNEKRYIGMTKQVPEDRWMNGNGYTYNNEMFSYIKVIGWDNVKKEIVRDGLTKDESRSIERSLIEIYRTASSEYGYNTYDNTTFINPIPIIKITIRQAVTRYGFCYQHIWNSIKSGKIQAERQGKIWWIEPGELEKLRDGRRTEK